MRKPGRLMTTAIAATAAAAAFAQTPAPARSPSPDGIASVQSARRPTTSPARVRERQVDRSHGRPLKRGRADLPGRHKRRDKGGATVWRAGANVLTRLRTEAYRWRSAATVHGEHDLHRHEGAPHTSISSQPAQAADDAHAEQGVGGVRLYARERRDTRPDARERLPYSIEQLTRRSLPTSPARRDAGG